MATLSLELPLYQEREREREREIVETITGAGDDLLFFKIMQICSFLKYSNKIKGTACSSLTRKSNTNYNGCWEPCIFCTGLQWSAERSNKIKPEIETSITIWNHVYIHCTRFCSNALFRDLAIISNTHLHL